MNEPQGKKQLFISHRHADEKLATTIKNHLVNWCAGDIEIFQSSDPQRGPEIGRDLARTIENRLAKSEVVLLVYTFADADWGYCMWEVGVATDPATSRTRVVVFQCTEDPPKALQHLVRVMITEKEIFKFATQFHKDSDFFPGRPACAPDLPEDALKTRGKDLCKELEKEIPAGKYQERPRWDRLTLWLSRDHVLGVRKEESYQRAVSAIEGNIWVKAQGEKVFGDVTKHFKIDALTEDMRFSELVRSWKEWAKEQKEENAGEEIPEEWIAELYAEMWRAICNKPAEPNWKYLRSARPGHLWFLPVVNHVRIFPDQAMEFDIFLYRMPQPGREQLSREVGKEEPKE
jgi:hypothetical protein